MDPNLSIILKDTYSSTQLKRRLRILKDRLLKDFFGSQNDQTGAIQPQDEAWVNSLPGDVFKAFTKDNVYKSFETIENSAKALPILTVYLPFELPEDGISRIGSQVRKMFAPNILLETKTDLSLIAGCALGWKGVVRDYSLKGKIEAKKEEVLSIFKKYLRANSSEQVKS